MRLTGAIYAAAGGSHIKGAAGFEPVTSEPTTALFPGRKIYNSTLGLYGFYDGTSWVYNQNASAAENSPITVVAANQVFDINEASAGARGTMSAAHYSLLEAATGDATGDTLVKRTATGQASFNQVVLTANGTDPNHAVTVQQFESALAGLAVKYDDVTVGIDGNGDLYLKQTYIQESAIDGSTIINDNGVFKVGTITSAQLANGAVNAAKLDAGVAGAGLSYDNTTGLAVKVDGVSVEINGDGNVAIKFGDSADYDAGTVGVALDAATIKAKIDAAASQNDKTLSFAGNGTNTVVFEHGLGTKFVDGQLSGDETNSVSWQYGAVSIDDTEVTVTFDSPNPPTSSDQYFIFLRKMPDAEAAIAPESFALSAISSSLVGFDTVNNAAITDIQVRQNGGSWQNVTHFYLAGSNGSSQTSKAAGLATLESGQLQLEGAHLNNVTMGFGSAWNGNFQINVGSTLTARFSTDNKATWITSNVYTRA